MTIVSKYILTIVALLLTLSRADRLGSPEIINDASSTERELWHNSKLEADIKHVLDDHHYKNPYDEIGGDIKIVYDGDDEDGLTMNLSYQLHDLPKFCKNCYISIMDKDSCGGSFSTKDHLYDDRRRLDFSYHDDKEESSDEEEDDHDDHHDDHDGHHDDDHDHHDDDDDGPWSLDSSDIKSDENGDAIGSLPGITNGYKFWKNRCKAAVVWALVEQDHHHHRGRTLFTSRRTHSGEKKVMRVIGCGVLKKKGVHDDCD